MRSRTFSFASGVVGLALALASMATHAETTTYFATQAPKSPLANNPSPPSLTSAVANQLGFFSGSIVQAGRNEFENGAAAGPGSFSYTGGTATLTGGAVVGRAQSEANLGRYNMTAGVPNDPTANGPWGHWLEATADFSYNFSTAVRALSFYGTDFGDLDGSFELSLYSGNTLLFSSGKIINAAVDALGRGNGNLLFYGVVSDIAFDRAVFSITQVAGATSFDTLGFDSIVVGNPVVGVPEPGSVALVGLALAAAGAATRKRKTA